VRTHTLKNGIFQRKAYVKMGEVHNRLTKGQVMTEYALILAAIAVIGFGTYEFMGHYITRLVNGGVGGSGVHKAFTPVPQTKDDCKNGGWRNFGFKNEAQCIALVKHNEGGGD
jgi:hypothetical protein